MDIKKELYIEAPAHESIYALGQSYVHKEKNIIIESIRHEAINTRVREIGGMGYYSPRIYERISYDNGKTWSVNGKTYQEDLSNMNGEHRYTCDYFLDPDNNKLLRFWATFDFIESKLHKETFSDEGTYSKTFRIFYQVSGDNGETWGKKQQVIHSGKEFDPVHWGPGLYYGENGGMTANPPVLKLRDGTILHTITVNLRDGKLYQSGFIRGKWKKDFSGLDWEFSDYISLPPEKSSQGACEIVPQLLDDGRIFVSIRACGDRVNKTFPSLKYWVISDDGGKTFSKPKVLNYEDGAPVWSPSSYQSIIRHSKNGKYYWIGNILDEPSYNSTPRFPLNIAELIPEQGVILRDTVILIDTKPDDFNEWRRYTNFGIYEDRNTNDIILIMPEQAKYSRDDFTSDCYKYRITNIN